MGRRAPHACVKVGSRVASGVVGSLFGRHLPVGRPETGKSGPVPRDGMTYLGLHSVTGPAGRSAGRGAGSSGRSSRAVPAISPKADMYRPAAKAEPTLHTQSPFAALTCRRAVPAGRWASVSLYLAFHRALGTAFFLWPVGLRGVPGCSRSAALRAGAGTDAHHRRRIAPKNPVFTGPTGLSRR